MSSALDPLAGFAFPAEVGFPFFAEKGFGRSPNQFFFAYPARPMEEKSAAKGSGPECGLDLANGLRLADQI
jgi:hypothetical protein